MPKGGSLSTTGRLSGLSGKLLREGRGKWSNLFPSDTPIHVPFCPLQPTPEKKQYGYIAVRLDYTVYDIIHSLTDNAPI